MSAVFFNYRRRTSHVSQGEVVWESKKKYYRHWLLYKENPKRKIKKKSEGWSSHGGSWCR
jgi:hypothetical protein